jgi:hypothetical protein
VASGSELNAGLGGDECRAFALQGLIVSFRWACLPEAHDLHPGMNDYSLPGSLVGSIDSGDSENPVAEGGGTRRKVVVDLA